MEKKPVLLNKSQSDLRTMVGDNHSIDSLKNIHVTPEYAEATNGYMTMRVPHDTMPAEDFPCVYDDRQGLPEEGTQVDPANLDKAFKNAYSRSSLPILSYVHLSLNDKGEPHVTATDLDTTVTFKQRKPEGTYPDTNVLFEEKKEWMFTLNAKQLKLICEWAVKHGQDSAIRFSVGQHGFGEYVVGIEVPRLREPNAYGLLMPCIGPYEKEQLQEREDRAAEAAGPGAPIEIEEAA